MPNPYVAQYLPLMCAAYSISPHIGTDLSLSRWYRPILPTAAGYCTMWPTASRRLTGASSLVRRSVHTYLCMCNVFMFSYELLYGVVVYNLIPYIVLRHVAVAVYTCPYTPYNLYHCMYICIYV